MGNEKVPLRMPTRFNFEQFCQWIDLIKTCKLKSKICSCIYIHPCPFKYVLLTLSPSDHRSNKNCSRYFSSTNQSPEAKFDPHGRYQKERKREQKSVDFSKSNPPLFSTSCLKMTLGERVPRNLSQEKTQLMKAEQKWKTIQSFSF